MGPGARKMWAMGQMMMIGALRRKSDEALSLDRLKVWYQRVVPALIGRSHTTKTFGLGQSRDQHA